jgi:hypothetical protein
VALISDGKDTVEGGKNFSVVELFGSDATGANVLFTTTSQLVPQDTDSQRDYYDAHLCTTSEPCIAPPATLTECHEESCHTHSGEGLRSTKRGANKLVKRGYEDGEKLTARSRRNPSQTKPSQAERIVARGSPRRSQSGPET